MSSPRSDAWHWQPRQPDGQHAPDEPATQLLYEPGNWGDLLKGAWAVRVTGALLEVERSGPFQYLDLYAGAPDYPVSALARERASGLEESALRTCLGTWTARDRWPSTATVVREVCRRHGTPVRLRVREVHEERRQRWIDLQDPDVEILPASGDVELDGTPGPDLVLIDPYDFFDHWGSWLPRIRSAATRVPVLVYLYNKSPRGPGHADQYRRFERRLRECATGGVALRLGRVASDARKPRAHHEVLLLGPERVVASLDDGLRSDTEALSEIQRCDLEYEPYVRV